MFRAHRQPHILIYSYLLYFCFRRISEDLVLMRSADFQATLCVASVENLTGKEKVLLSSMDFCGPVVITKVGRLHRLNIN